MQGARERERDCRRNYSWWKVSLKGSVAGQCTPPLFGKLNLSVWTCARAVFGRLWGSHSSGWPHHFTVQLILVVHPWEEIVGKFRRLPPFQKRCWLHFEKSGQFSNGHVARTTVGGGIIATHFRDIWFSPGAPFPHFNVGTSERFFFRLPQVAGNIVNVEMGERGDQENTFWFLDRLQ